MDQTHELEFTRPVCRMTNYISALGAIAVDVMVSSRRLQGGWWNVADRSSHFTLTLAWPCNRCDDEWQTYVGYRVCGCMKNSRFWMAQP